MIHAGTHKTATSYIQSRIKQNITSLSDAGVYVRYPSNNAQKHKPLATWLSNQNFEEWDNYLHAVPDDINNVLVSAEQFTQPISKKKLFKPLKTLLAQRGFQLRIVIFVRDQPDYMNARYVHSTRRLYHAESFEEYVSKQLRERELVYDYSVLFKDLIAFLGSHIDFLPYGSTYGDPFDRLMNSQSWQSSSGWKPADPSKRNIQPGCKGVWLAQQVFRQLTKAGINASSLRNTGGVIRDISSKSGWEEQRFYGFTPDLYARVVKHYQSCNNSFAQAVWNCDWSSVFPMQNIPQAIYEGPMSDQENEAMHRLVMKCVKKLS